MTSRVTAGGLFDEPNKYSGNVYDAVWLYALALDRYLHMHASIRAECVR